MKAAPEKPTTHTHADTTDTADTVLRLKGISKIYPGTIALHHVDLDIIRGETHGIIGKNGAGKSTLVGIIAGLVTPSAGSVELHGRIYRDLSRIAARKESVSIVPQEPQMVAEATIAENLFMPDYPRRRGGALVDWRKMERAAATILARAGIELDVRSRAGDLSLGMQQVTLMLKASYVEHSEIIILDEAFASLSEREEALFFKIMQERKAAGCTILHISHRVDELLQVCDRMTVLRDGKSIGTVHRSEVNHDSLSALIVGPRTPDPTVTPDPTAGPHRTAPGSLSATPETRSTDTPPAPLVPPALTVHRLSRQEHFTEVSFSVNRNEILGIAGLMGSGRTSIMKAIYGLPAPDGGEILLDGVPVTISDPATALRRGIVYLPEDRDAEGLIAGMDVRVNTLLSALKRVTRRFLINRPRERALATELTRTLEVKYASLDQEVRELSGGNRQKVVVAKVFSTTPAVYLLDEPTKGIDIAARAGLLRIIRETLARDAAVLVSAPGLEELMEICDRILVLHRGRVVAEFPREKFSEDTLYRAIQGGHTENKGNTP